MNRIRGVLLLNAMLMLGTAVADPQPAPATAKDDAATQKSTASADAQTNCVRETGSLIRSRSNRDCNEQPGRSYSREDIDRTGATDPADALRMLDPSVTVRR